MGSRQSGKKPFQSTQYHNDPKFSDRQIWANMQTKVRLLLGLHCLLFYLHHLEVSHQGRTSYLEFQSVYRDISGYPNIKKLYGIPVTSKS